MKKALLTLGILLICTGMFSCSLDQPVHYGSFCSNDDNIGVELDSIVIEEDDEYGQTVLKRIHQRMTVIDPQYEPYHDYFKHKYFCPEEFKCVVNFHLPGKDNDGIDDLYDVDHSEHTYSIKECPTGTHEVQDDENGVRCVVDTTNACGRPDNDCENSEGWKEGDCINGKCMPTECQPDYNVSMIKSKCVLKDECCGQFCANCKNVGEKCIYGEEISLKDEICQ